MRRIVLLAALALTWGGVCFAETSMKAEVDKATITVDETVTYKLNVISSDRNVSQPAFPEFTRFDVLSQSQSSSFSFSEGGTKTMLVYVLVLFPRETGTLEIPAASLSADGTRVSSGKLSVRVTPGTGKFRRPQPSPDAPKKRLPPDLGNEPQYEI